MRRLLLLLVLTSSLNVQAGEPPPAAMTTEVIATQRPAEELLLVLQPLAGADVSVQAYQGQLILRGSSERIAALRAVIAQLDRPLRNLRISVRRYDDAAQSRTQAGAQWHSHRGSAVGLQSTQEQTQTNDTQQLVLLEGAVARLSLDTEIPVLGLASSGAVTTTFVPLGNGIELKPMLSGDRIRLEVRRRDARVEGSGIATESVQSVLLLEPGVWTDLGAVAGTDSGQTGNIRIQGKDIAITRDERRDGNQMRWDVRVDLFD